MYLLIQEDTVACSMTGGGGGGVRFIWDSYKYKFEPGNQPCPIFVSFSKHYWMSGMSERYMKQVTSMISKCQVAILQRG